MTTYAAPKKREGGRARVTKSESKTVASEEYGRTYSIDCLNLNKAEYD